MSSPVTYPITTVCRLTGLSSRTLRRWESLGLLTPAGVDGRGYRLYDHGSLAVVLHLLLLRVLGIPTPERTTWTPSAPPAPVLDRAADVVLEHTRLAPELARQLGGYTFGLHTILAGLKVLISEKTKASSVGPPP